MFFHIQVPRGPNRCWHFTTDGVALHLFFSAGVGLIDSLVSHVPVGHLGFESTKFDETINSLHIVIRTFYDSFQIRS